MRSVLLLTISTSISCLVMGLVMRTPCICVFPEMPPPPPPPVRRDPPPPPVVVLSPEFVFYPNTDTSATLDLEYVNRTNAKACMTRCLARRPQCLGVVLRQTECWLKSIPFSPFTRPGTNTYFLRDSFHSSNKKGPPKIAFGMMASVQFMRTRVEVALSTWFANVTGHVYIERTPESESFAKDAQHPKGLVVTMVEPPDAATKSVNGAWKNLPIVKDLSDRYPDAEWYVIVDDDTYIIQSNLQRVLGALSVGSSSSQNTPLYIGAAFMSSGAKDAFEFIQGGGGIVMNRAAVRRISPHIRGCVKRHAKEWAGDIRLGACFREYSVPTHPHPAFWSQDIFLSMGRDQRWAYSDFPVSFHVMRDSSWVYALRHAELFALTKNDGGDDPYRKGVVDWHTLREYFNTSFMAHQFPKELYQGEALP